MMFSLSNFRIRFLRKYLRCIFPSSSHLKWREDAAVVLNLCHVPGLVYEIISLGHMAIATLRPQANGRSSLWSSTCLVAPAPLPFFPFPALSATFWCPVSAHCNPDRPACLSNAVKFSWQTVISATGKAVWGRSITLRLHLRTQSFTRRVAVEAGTTNSLDLYLETAHSAPRWWVSAQLPTSPLCAFPLLHFSS